MSVFPTYPEKFNPDTATDLTFFVTFPDCLGLAGTGLNGEACKGCASVHSCSTDVGRCKGLIPHSAGMPKKPRQLHIRTLHLAFSNALFLQRPSSDRKAALRPDQSLRKIKYEKKLAFDKNA